MKKVSIEYAHIYTNNRIDEEHALSLEILEQIAPPNTDDISLVVMVDDYSFPDPTFDYNEFLDWLEEKGYKPDVMLRESQLIPVCDDVLQLIEQESLKEQLVEYIKAKKYPCSLFIAGWYLLRFGILESDSFPKEFTAEKLINILPSSFKSFEDKALEIIGATKHGNLVDRIEHKYFEGRIIA